MSERYQHHTQQLQKQVHYWHTQAQILSVQLQDEHQKRLAVEHQLKSLQQLYELQQVQLQSQQQQQQQQSSYESKMCGIFSSVSIAGNNRTSVIAHHSSSPHSIIGGQQHHQQQHQQQHYQQYQQQQPSSVMNDSSQMIQTSLAATNSNTTIVSTNMRQTLGDTGAGGQSFVAGAVAGAPHLHPSASDANMNGLTFIDTPLMSMFGGAYESHLPSVADAQQEQQQQKVQQIENLSLNLLPIHSSSNNDSNNNNNNGTATTNNLLHMDFEMPLGAIPSLSSSAVFNIGGNANADNQTIDMNSFDLFPDDMTVFTGPYHQLVDHNSSSLNSATTTTNNPTNLNFDVNNVSMNHNIIQQLPVTDYADESMNMNMNMNMNVTVDVNHENVTTVDSIAIVCDSQFLSQSSTNSFLSDPRFDPCNETVITAANLDLQDHHSSNSISHHSNSTSMHNYNNHLNLNLNNNSSNNNNIFGGLSPSPPNFFL
jgi:hypothetical protein